MKNSNKKILLFSAIMLLSSSGSSLMSCSKDNNFDLPGMFPDNVPGDLPGGIPGADSDDGDIPEVDTSISQWDGSTADDVAQDVIGQDENLYWEANGFGSDGAVTVTVIYSDTHATVTTSDSSVKYYTDGAYVTIDMLTNSVKNVEIIVNGNSADGQLKIYGENKFKLTLAGVDLTSCNGPAINNQCKKRVFVHLKEATTNRLTDASSYSDDTCYLNGGSRDSEDRKGCFFSEGNLIVSGTGTLIVNGKYKHAIATDGCFYMRPGATVVIAEAAKNAIHAKGDKDDAMGVFVAGGLIHANVSSTAGKCIKTDLNVDVTGGKLLLNTSGDAEYDADDKDTSSAACIKADGYVSISGGEHVLKSTGTGGKGINADGEVNVAGGKTIVTTNGGKFYYSSDLTSSPKGVKADGDITVSDGSLCIYVLGASDGSEGLESKSTINVSGGDIYSYAYDDAVNASTAINVSGGKIYAYSSTNDGIDSNGSITISGGVVIGIGASGAESGIDCDASNNFRINGGTVIGMGGTMQSSPSTSSTQCSVVYNGISLAKNTLLCVLDESNSTILTFKSPRTVNAATLFFTTPDILSNKTYIVSSGGALKDCTELWIGLYTDGTWSDGSQIGSFTQSSTVTTVGNSGMPGGNIPGGMPGGNPWGAPW